MSQSSPTRRFLLLGGLASAGVIGLAGCGGGTSQSAARQPTTDTAPDAPPPPAPTPTGGPIVTILGDSIAAGLGLPAAEALPSQLQRALAAEGSTLMVRGAGISGDTLEAGLARLDFSVGDDTAICVVALGGNDLLRGTPVPQVRASLDAIVQRLKGRGIRVVLAGVAAPTRASGDYGREFAAAFAEVARTRRVEAFVPNLLEGVGTEQRQADGMHPNSEGVRRMVARLVPLLTAQAAAR